tara:strand:- start:2568 stop:3059 length:492 start_codon:yes stop_codon:yes gene_type:complete
MKYVSKIQKDIQIQISSELVNTLEHLSKEHTVPNIKLIDFNNYLITVNEYPKFKKLLKAHNLSRTDRIAIKTILNSIHKVILNDIFTYTNIDSFKANDTNKLYQIYSKRYDEYYEHASFEVFSDYEQAMKQYQEAQKVMPEYEWSFQTVYSDDIEDFSIIKRG